MSKRDDREIELLLWGATGFTGRLAAEFLAARYAGERIALAGRSADKLEKLRDELVAIDARCASWAVRTADAFDVPALDRLVPEARVVASTVGPFSIHGHELAAACARHGTDYCDITGEVPFARSVIDWNESRAKETGARLVPFCGFDSVPSDLGVFALQEFARRELGEPCKHVTFVIRATGGVSGGTAATMIAIMEQASKDANVRKMLANPYALASRRGPARDATGAKKIGGRWTAPFFMGPVNSRVVHRSNMLLGNPYGEDFTYEERMITGGRATATLVSVGGLAAMVSLGLAPMRSLAKRFVPAPGTGPSKEVRDQGRFDVRFDGANAHGDVVATCNFTGRGDPGYTCAARLLVESALCLSRDTPICPAACPLPRAWRSRSWRASVKSTSPSRRRSSDVTVDASARRRSQRARDRAVRTTRRSVRRRLRNRPRGAEPQAAKVSVRAGRGWRAVRRAPRSAADGDRGGVRHRAGRVGGALARVARHHAVRRRLRRARA